MSVPLITAGVTIAKDVVKEFSSAFSDLKEFGERGAGEVRNTLNTLTNSLSVINPILVPMQLISAQLATGTAESSLNLTKELVEFIQSDNFKLALAFITQTVNGILDTAAKITDVLGKMESIPSMMNRVEAAITEPFVRVQAVIESTLSKLEQTVTEPFERAHAAVDTAVNNIEAAITAPFRRLETTFNDIATKLDAIVKKINPFD